MIATRRSLNFTVPLVLDPPRHCGLSSIALVPGRHLLGSAADCDIRLSFAGVQPRHAIILVGENRTIVKSMDARTWINDGPLTEMALRPGDRLSVGPVTFRVRSASKDELAAFETAVDDVDLQHLAVDADVSAPIFDNVLTDVAVEPFVPKVLPAVVETTLEPVVVAPVAIEPTVTAIDSSLVISDLPLPEAVEVVSLDSRLDEIQQRLAELELTATSTSRPTDVHNSENVLWAQSLRMREADVLRRVEQLAVDTEHLQERSALVVTQEMQLEQQRQQLVLEAERIAEVAESTRRSLSQEHAQHLSVWQDWEAAYQRMTTDVASQLDSVERQRQTLQAEADRLSLARTELQRVQLEHEHVLKETTVAQRSLAQDRVEFNNHRSQFEAHRLQCQREIEEHRRQTAAARRELDLSKTELTVSLQQLERDRQVVLAERAEQVKRLEIDNQRRASIQSELEEQRRGLRTEHEQLSTRQVDFRRQQLEFEERQTRLAQNQRADAEAADRQHQSLLQQLQQLEQELVLLRHAPSVVAATSESRAIESSVVESLLPEPREEVSQSLSVPPSEPEPETPIPILESWPSESVSVVEPPSATAIASGEFTAPEIEQPAGLGSASIGIGDSIWSRPEVQSFEPREFPSTFTESSVAPLDTPATTNFPTDWMSHVPSSSAPGLATRSPDPWGVPDLAALSALSMSLHPTTSAEPSLMPTGIDPWDSFKPSTDARTDASTFEATAVQLAAPAVDTSRKVGGLEADSSAVPHFDPLTNQQLTVDQTLAVVNRDFGVPIEEEAESPVPETLPSWWVEAPQTAATETFKVEKPDWATEGVTTETPAVASEVARVAEAANNPTDLRSTLATLFDLPALATTSGDQTEPSAELEDVTEEVPDSVATEAPSTTAVNNVDVEPATDEAEDSVEDFMARLLARSRGEGSPPVAATVALSAKVAKAAPVEDDVVSFTMPAETDRSHLMAAPKHKQDKQAVRDNLKSFRQVAHLSARSALARHSLQQLRNATIAKGILLGASGIATMWFFSQPLWGREIQMWKAGACALAALLSSVEFSRSWTQLFKPIAAPGATNTVAEQAAGAPGEVLDDAPIEIVVEAPTSTEAVPTEPPSESTSV